MVSESGRISPEDHENMKSFLTKIVSYFNIGPDKVQIGNIFTTSTIHTTAPGTITTTVCKKYSKY